MKRDLTKLTIEELYKEMEYLQRGLEVELSMDGSGELIGKIIDDFKPYFDRIEAEIESRSEEEHDKYHWPEEEDDIPC